MIRKCFFAFVLVFSGCKYPEKDDGGAWKAADCFAILCDEFSQNSIEMAKFNMEKCLCGRYSVSYKFFDDDACAISIWELDGRICKIRIESHLPSAFLAYVIKDKYSLKKEAQWLYVEPEFGFCVQNNHRVSIPLERVLKLLNVDDVISYSRMNFGPPNAKTTGSDYLVYWFKIVDRPNLVMNLTLFSKDSWLIEVFPVGRKASATVNVMRNFRALSKSVAMSPAAPFAVSAAPAEAGHDMGAMVTQTVTTYTVANPWDSLT